MEADVKRNRNNTKITANNMARRAEKGYSPSRDDSSLNLVLDYIQLMASLGFSNLAVSHEEPMFEHLLAPGVHESLVKAGFKVWVGDELAEVEWHS